MIYKIVKQGTVYGSTQLPPKPSKSQLKRFFKGLCENHIKCSTGGYIKFERLRDGSYIIMDRTGKLLFEMKATVSPFRRAFNWLIK